MKERLTELTRQHFAIKKSLEALNSEDDAIKAEIKLLLRQEGLDKTDDLDGNLVTYKEQTRESVDKNKVKSLLGEIQFKEVVKSTTFETLRITTKEQLEMLKNRNGRKKQ